MKTCEFEFIVAGGSGEIETCGKSAAFIINADKDSAYPVCEECAKSCDPQRLTLIIEELE